MPNLCEIQTCSVLAFKQNHLDFGRCPNTKLSMNGTEVERPRTLLVGISAFHCNYINIIMDNDLLVYYSFFQCWALAWSFTSSPKGVELGHQGKTIGPSVL